MRNCFPYCDVWSWVPGSHLFRFNSTLTQRVSLREPDLSQLPIMALIRDFLSPRLASRLRMTPGLESIIQLHRVRDRGGRSARRTARTRASRFHTACLSLAAPLQRRQLLPAVTLRP